ncbi:MAG: cytochrome c3 family protein [Acidobacteriota bacterium]|nr:cytochrome c3 family protein [Acidobacteriota bacterium]
MTRQTMLRLALALSLAVTASAAFSVSQEDCTACHEEPAPEVFEESVHGFFECADCHGGVEEFPHAEPLPAPDCSSCHGDAVEAHADSVHARTETTPSSRPAATCADCHGSHDIKPSSDRASRTYHLTVPDTCARCHGAREPDTEAAHPPPRVFASFDDSIHGEALRKHGLLVAPNCATCHGSHAIKSSADPESPIHRASIPGTCGDCHAGIIATYEKSIHGQSVSGGNLAAALCTDCHSAHDIGQHDVPDWRLEVVKECGTCHAESIETYHDTFHGQVTSLGFSRVATCSDCHGAHDILPRDSPESRVSGERLLATCQNCHPSATRKFVLYDPHPRPDDPEHNRVLYYSKKSMQLLLAGVFSFFFVHTALWVPRSFQAALRKRRRNRSRGGAGTAGSGKEAGRHE